MASLRIRRSPITRSATAIAALCAAVLAGCDKPASPLTATTPPSSTNGGTPTPPAEASNSSPAASGAETPSATTAPKGEAKDEVKIMVEKWENGNMKFWNEMRRDANGKWQKNGLGRAYYANGVLEREGMYKDGKRVGRWQFYDQDGKPSMVDERGDGTLPGTR